MTKQNKPYSILELPLYTEPWQRDALDKKLECSRRIYNALLSAKLKQYGEMVKTREWRELCAIIAEELGTGRKKKSELLKKAYERKNEIIRANGFTEFDLRSDAIVFSKYYQKHISSTMASMGIGVPMWAAFEELFYGDGKEVSFKKYDSVLSLVSDNKSGIRFLQADDGRYYVLCSNKKAKAKPVKLWVKGPDTEYDRRMLSAEIKVIRIIKKIEKGHRKYYCQLTVERAPYIKLDKDGTEKHKLGTDDVGIAIWRNRLYAVSADEVFTTVLSPDAERFEMEKKNLDRELQYLRRVNNPDNYNEDGTVKNGIIGEDGKRHRLKWVRSNHYLKVKAQRKELCRKHAVDKILHQNKVVLKLLSMGNTFHMASMSFINDKPEWDEDNRLSNSEYKTKKERRKSIQEGAPSALIGKLGMKLSARGLEPIHTYKIPENRYWYRHDTGLSDENFFKSGDIVMCGHLVSQTAYRAFLIRHFDEVEGEYNRDVLAREWNDFFAHFSNCSSL